MAKRWQSQAEISQLQQETAPPHENQDEGTRLKANFVASMRHSVRRSG